METGQEHTEHEQGSEHKQGLTYQMLGGLSVPGAEYWGKSTRSTVQAGNCVSGKAAFLGGQIVNVEIADSKNMSSDGGNLTPNHSLNFPPQAWGIFIEKL